MCCLKYVWFNFPTLEAFCFYKFGGLPVSLQGLVEISESLPNSPQAKLMIPPLHLNNTLLLLIYMVPPNYLLRYHHIVLKLFVL